MKDATRAKKRVPFQFVLEELAPIRPTVKSMFGLTYAFLGERLMLLLRERDNRPEFNGIFIPTTVEHLESLRREFPLLPRRNVWVSGENGCVFLQPKLEEFEQYALRACELITGGDRRIGRLTQSRRKKAGGEKVARGKGRGRRGKSSRSENG